MSSNPVIILVRPQLEENIGAVARVMMNFGFSTMYLIEPKCNWLGEKAISVACSASKILYSATEFSSIEEAACDLNYLYALSVRKRSICIDDMELPEISQKKNYKVGVMFGPENSGLSNHDLSLVDKVISINTPEEYKSLNLSQAVAIVCYELNKNNFKESDNLDEKQTAKKSELNLFFKYLEAELVNKNFFKTKEKIPTAMLNIKNMLKKHDFTSDEVKTLHGIIKSLSCNKTYGN